MSAVPTRSRVRESEQVKRDGYKQFAYRLNFAGCRLNFLAIQCYSMLFDSNNRLKRSLGQPVGAHDTSSLFFLALSAVRRALRKPLAQTVVASKRAYYERQTPEEAFLAWSFRCLKSPDGTPD